MQIMEWRGALNFQTWEINNNGKLIGTSDDSKIEKAPWLYQQQLLGFNYRITDIQCALELQFKE